MSWAKKMFSSYAVGAVLMCAVVAASFFAGRASGEDACQLAQKRAIEQVLASQADELEKARKAAENVRTITKEKVRTVYVEKDDSGCADTVVPDGMLKQLSNSN